MKRLALLPLLLGFLPFSGHSATDIIVADFEGDSYGTWTTQGDAFGTRPAAGALPGQMAVTGFEGRQLANSFIGGDKSTGKLTSPAILIEKPFLNFLIGGGGFAGKTCLNLLLDDKIVRTATGPNEHSGGSEQLAWMSWNVAELNGKAVVLEIVDAATGGWGHINVDQITQSDRKAGPMLADQHREFLIEKKFLNLPVKNGAPKRRLRFQVDDQLVDEFEIELAPRQPDFWVFIETEKYRGRRASLHADRLPDDTEWFSRIEQDDSIKDATDLYHEKNRPQFHFSSRRGWLNDPNGLVYYQGEYHLFYQHNPFGREWGNMHWGHAVSSNLVHWHELPIALAPHRFGDWAFSGSAVVDWKNSSGYQRGNVPPLLAAYTSTGRGECVVYSNDRGRTWTESDANPVVKHRGRDPKVIWHPPTRRWIMVVYHEEGTGKVEQTIDFHSSTDLKEWRFESRVPGFFECPDFFELPVDGDASKSRWVLSAADSDYMIGTFDGRKFTRESGKHKGNYGNCFYAAQTYSDIPTQDGRRIQIGWARIDLRGMPFNQMMAFPCELSLRSTSDGVRLCAWPVREMETLRQKHHSWTEDQLPANGEPVLSTGELLDLRLQLKPGTEGQLTLQVGGNDVVYDIGKKELSCAGRKAPLQPVDGTVSLRVLVDRTSLEIFGNKGEVYMPLGVYPRENQPAVALTRTAQSGRVEKLEIDELASAWTH